MKLLLLAALRNRKHLSLLIVTFLTLFALTIASQMEMFSLGVLSSNGADFFSLFSTEHVEKAGEMAQDSVSLQEVQSKWHEIDPTGSGVITKKDAVSYLAQHNKETNPLNWILCSIKQKFKFSNNLKALVLILLCVAVFKAIWLFASRYTTQLLAIRISRDLRQQYFEHKKIYAISKKDNTGKIGDGKIFVLDLNEIAISINS